MLRWLEAPGRAHRRARRRVDLPGRRRRGGAGRARAAGASAPRSSGSTATSPRRRLTRPAPRPTDALRARVVPVITAIVMISCRGRPHPRGGRGHRRAHGRVRGLLGHRRRRPHRDGAGPRRTRSSPTSSPTGSTRCDGVVGTDDPHRLPHLLRARPRGGLQPRPRRRVAVAARPARRRAQDRAIRRGASARPTAGVRPSPTGVAATHRVDDAPAARVDRRPGSVHPARTRVEVRLDDPRVRTGQRQRDPGVEQHRVADRPRSPRRTASRTTPALCAASPPRSASIGCSSRPTARGSSERSRHLTRPDPPHRRRGRQTVSSSSPSSPRNTAASLPARGEDAGHQRRHPRVGDAHRGIRRLGRVGQRAEEVERRRRCRARGAARPRAGTTGGRSARSRR